MNKMIKVATMVAGIGAMLNIVGCGEKDPAKEVAATFREVNATLTNAGFEPIVPEDGIAPLENGVVKPEELKEVLEQKAKLDACMPMFKKYVSILKEVKSIDSTIYKDLLSPERFPGENPQAQSEALKKAEDKFKQLKALKEAMGK